MDPRYEDKLRTGKGQTNHLELGRTLSDVVGRPFSMYGGGMTL